MRSSKIIRAISESVSKPASSPRASNIPKYCGRTGAVLGGGACTIAFSATGAILNEYKPASWKEIAVDVAAGAIFGGIPGYGAGYFAGKIALTPCASKVFGVAKQGGESVFKMIKKL